MNRKDLAWIFDWWLVRFECEVDSHFAAGHEDLGLEAFYKWHREIAAAIESIDSRAAKSFRKSARPFAFGPGTKKAPTQRAQFMQKCGGPAIRYLLRLKQELHDGTVGLKVEDRKRSLTTRSASSGTGNSDNQISMTAI